MSQNVYERLSNTKPSLVQRMCSNTHVSSTVMAYLNLLCGLSIRYGYPISNVRIDPLEEGARNTFRAKVHFDKIATQMPRMWGTQSSFVEFARAKANHLALALKHNPRLESFFESMVEVLDIWAKMHNTRFEDVAIIDPIITQNEYVLTFKVGKRADLA